VELRFGNVELRVANVELRVGKVELRVANALMHHSLIVANVSSRDGRGRTCGSFDKDNFMSDFDSSPLATMLQNGSSLPDTTD